jgi:phosphoribosylformylglycinamidine synthase
MIGLIEDDTKVMIPSLRESGLKLALIGRFHPHLGGSEYQKLRTGRTEGTPPDVDLNHEKVGMDLILSLIQQQHVAAVQDVSIGGLLTTLLEMTFQASVGVALSTESLQAGHRLDECLFGETAGTYIVAYRPEQEAALRRQCTGSNQFIPLGETISAFELRLDQQPAIPLQPLKDRWSQTLAVL